MSAPARTAQGIAGPKPPLEPLAGKNWDYFASLRVSVKPPDSSRGLQSAPLPAGEAPKKLREHPNFAFNLPPTSYEFDPSNENDPGVLETAETFGLVTVRSRDLDSAIRRFEKITGTNFTYYTGGHPELAGFTPPSRPNLIFIYSNVPHHLPRH